MFALPVFFISGEKNHCDQFNHSDLPNKYVQFIESVTTATCEARKKSSVVECLPSMHEALGSILNTAQENKSVLSCLLDFF